MSERGLVGPVFYKGFFGHPSILARSLTPEQRAQYRRLYKSLMKSFGHRDFSSKMKARAVVRDIIYADMKGGGD